jgi:hypothetical protein
MVPGEGVSAFQNATFVMQIGRIGWSHSLKYPARLPGSHGRHRPSASLGGASHQPCQQEGDPRPRTTDPRQMSPNPTHFISAHPARHFPPRLPWALFWVETIDRALDVGLWVSTGGLLPRRHPSHEWCSHPREESTTYRCRTRESRRRMPERDVKPFGGSSPVKTGRSAHGVKNVSQSLCKRGAGAASLERVPQ